MKLLPQIASFVLGAGVTGGVFLLRSPPSRLDLGIELGRKLGLAGAEKRYAEYKAGREVLQVDLGKAEKRTEVAEKSLRVLRKKITSEARRLKKIELYANATQRQASQKQPALRETLDSSFESLEAATESSDQVTKEAVVAVKVASRELYNNCVIQLRAANQEGGSLHLQLALKVREVGAISTSRNAWKDLAEKEEQLRKNAEAYIKDRKGQRILLWALGERVGGPNLLVALLVLEAPLVSLRATVSS